MPITAFLHTHILVVVIFLLFFATKTLLLLLDKKEMLATVRNKTKVLDMILGTLILVTGGWMLLNYNGELPAYLLLKISLTLIGIPLGIIGLKNGSKVLTSLALLLFIYTYAVAEADAIGLLNNDDAETSTLPVNESPETDAAETGDSTFSESEETQNEIVASMNETALANAQKVYVQQCATCHGEDGQKGANDAANLAASSLSMHDMKDVISKGRGLMPGFGEQLSEQDIDELAAYTLTLKK
ncbi:c-type cytochrome [Pontibacter vulgaris]|uniref:c-type cytochrome n=1 Tax=Pontibacter vulgaris TaxID=2905679 RepID=UPI001FA76AC7|nr:c-type cytochrome [Pontibacter vulgaris]